MGDIEKRPDNHFLPFKRIDKDYDDLPAGPGAYILLASDRTTWPYPWCRSPVFYIGKAKSLRVRLWDHWDGARHARKSERYGIYYAVNHYAAEFPTRFIAVHTWQRMTPDGLEEELIGRFVGSYGARPVASSQTRWNRT
jgi:hypothetical protein